MTVWTKGIPEAICCAHCGLTYDAHIAGSAECPSEVAHERIRRLTAENKDLHEQIAALESKEVCTKPHDDHIIDGCPYCRIEELNGAVDRHMTRLQLEQSRTQAQAIEIQDLREALAAHKGWH